MNNTLKVFTGQSNSHLADGICSSLGIGPGEIEFVRFSNENIKVKICENVRGCDVFFVQTSCPPVSDHLMELLIALDALKFASAKRITAVLPYFPYALMDKKDEPRISVSGRLMAALIAEAGAQRILTMTLHSPQIMGFSRVPVDQLSGVPTICEYYSKRDLGNSVVASPPISRAKVSESYARRLGLPLAVIDRREGPTGDTSIHGVIGDVDGKDVLFFDDEVVTGESILRGAEAVAARGARKIFAGCVHGTLAGETIRHIGASSIERLAITDTVPLQRIDSSGKIEVCSVATLFAAAIKAIYEETSISALFN